MASTIPTASKDALQIALMGGLSPEALQAQRAFGNRQMLDGTSGAPVQHWTQGLNRVAQGVVGGLRERDSRQQEQQAALLNREAIMKAMNGGSLEDSAGMLMGNPATSDMGMKLAQSAISSRQQQAQASAAQQAKIEAENRAFERQKELIKYKSQFGGDGSGSYGKAGTIVQGPNGQFYSVQFGSDGTRRILPLTFEQAQAEGMLGDGWQGVRGGDQPQPSQAVPLSPAKGIKEVDAGTKTILVDNATGGRVGEISKDLAGAEEQKIEGKTRGEIKANAPKAAATLRSLEQQWSLVDRSIDKAIAETNWASVGFVGNLAQVVPGSPAFDLKNTLETIRANIGFDKLQDMRDNSPTGGALGQVSEFENRLLQSVRGSLQQGQSAEQLQENLLRVKRDLAALQQERRNAYAQTYGPGSQQAMEQQAEQPKSFVYDPATGELRPK